MKLITVDSRILISEVLQRNARRLKNFLSFYSNALFHETHFPKQNIDLNVSPRGINLNFCHTQFYFLTVYMFNNFKRKIQKIENDSGRIIFHAIKISCGEILIYDK